jgi:hypothetical protein
LSQLRPQLGHNGFALSADCNHPVCFKVERDQFSVSLGALLLQSRQSFFRLRRFTLQRL